MRPRQQQQQQQPQQGATTAQGGIQCDHPGGNEPNPVGRASSPASTKVVGAKEKSSGRISPRRGGRLSPWTGKETRPGVDEGHRSAAGAALKEEEDRAGENSNEEEGDGSRRAESVDEEAEPRWRAGAELEVPARRRISGREGSSSSSGGTMIVHEALVRERDEEDDATFDDLYQVLEEIGRGGLCTVYKIRKYPEKVGGSARRSLALSRRRTSSTSFLQNLVGGGGGAAAQPTQASGGFGAETASMRDAVRRELLLRHGGHLSAPGTPTKNSGWRQQPQQQHQQHQQPQPPPQQQGQPALPQQQQGLQPPPRRRTKNVRSMSSPSSLAMNSTLWHQRADRASLDLTAPFWTRADGTSVFTSAAGGSTAQQQVDGGAAIVNQPQQNQQQPQRRLDVRTLRTAFKRTHITPRNENGQADSPEILYAVKVFNLKLLTPAQARQLKNEVEALKTLDHPSIIKAYETFTCKESKQLMLVMELCTGGDLYARIPYQEADVARVLYQVLSALIYMHDRNVVHRDLKLENIMFESPHPAAAIKLIDFGLAARFGSSSGAMLGTSSVLKERVGTLYCMAPCVLLGKGYTSKAGMWSVGVIAYTMLSGGNHPFHGKTPKQVVARILQAEYSFGGDENDDSGDAWNLVSDDAKSFITAMLRIEPDDRPTARQAIKHPWIRRHSSVSSQSDVSQFWQPAIDEGVPVAKGQHGLVTTHPDALDSAKSEEWKHRVTSEMVKYAEWSDFRKLALNVIAKRSTSDEIFEIRKVFAEFDTENSGTITLDDFRSALTQYDPTYSDEELEDIFRKIDVGGTSVINYTEFLASALEARGSIEEWKLAEAFDMLDRDGSGCISRDDLRRVVGDHADDSYLDELIAQAGGSTKDGRISYPEFLRAFSEQTHDLVYGMYEASRSKSSSHLPGSSDASGGTDSILERRGIAIPRLVLVTARQRLMNRRKKLAASAKSKLAGALQVLTPTTKEDVMTYVTTGRPNPR